MALGRKSGERAIGLTHGAGKVVVFGREDPQQTGLAVLVLEVDGHGLRRAIAGTFDAEHDEWAMLQRIPELVLDFAIVGHLVSPHIREQKRPRPARRSLLRDDREIDRAGVVAAVEYALGRGPVIA